MSFGSTAIFKFRIITKSIIKNKSPELTPPVVQRFSILWRNSPTRDQVPSFLRFLDISLSLSLSLSHTHTRTHTHTHTHTHTRETNIHVLSDIRLAIPEIQRLQIYTFLLRISKYIFKNFCYHSNVNYRQNCISVATEFT
jgi:hypothetical protein